MSDISYKQLKSSSPIFWKNDKYVYTSIILDYVEDLIFVFYIESLLMSEVTKLLSLFERTGKELQWNLGIHIAFWNETLVLSAKKYIGKVLDQFIFTHCKHCSTPIITNVFKNHAHYSASMIIETEQYSNMIGCVQIKARKARPEIILSSNILAK